MHTFHGHQMQKSGIEVGGQRSEMKRQRSISSSIKNTCTKVPVANFQGYEEL